jgi:hypothetical protein
MECNHSRVVSLGFATGCSTRSSSHIVKLIAVNRQLQYRVIKLAALNQLLQRAHSD